ncbi:MAG: hypothetical protein JST84_06465 [Acidobacteria bacterium]|nr:hypothetical protein [Acidobacteriota bacterium]
MYLKKVSLIAACLLTFCATVVFAASIDGKWTGQVQGPQGAMDLTVVLKAEGEKLTGTMTNQMGETAIKDGSIKGDDVAFKVDREFNGMKFTVVYKGKLAGDELKLTRTIEGDFGGQTPPPTDFTLKRAK